MKTIAFLTPLTLLLTLGWHVPATANQFCTDLPPNTQTSIDPDGIPPSGGECTVNVMASSLPRQGSVSVDTKGKWFDYHGVLAFWIDESYLLGSSSRKQNTARVLEAGFLSGEGRSAKGIRLDVTLTQRFDGTGRLVFDYFDSVPVAQSIAIDPAFRGDDLLLVTRQSLIDSRSCELSSAAARVSIDRTSANGMVVDIQDIANWPHSCHFPIGPSMAVDLTQPLLRWGVINPQIELDGMSFRARWETPTMPCDYPADNCGQR